MQHDNNIENKLRQLEAMEQPDLSQLDNHWQQMQAMLQPAAVPVKKGWPKWMLNSFYGAAVLVMIIAAVWFLAYNRNTTNDTGSLNSARPDTAKANMAVVYDTTLPDKNEAAIHDSNTTSKKTLSIDPSLVLDNMVAGDTVQWTEQDSILGTIKLKVTDCGTCPVKTDGVPVISHTERKMKLQSLFSQLEKEEQHFTIDNSRDTLLKFKEGTVLLVPANSFGGMKGIEIRAKEFYKTSDILSAKLNTASDNLQLETGGMLHLEASFKGRALSDTLRIPLTLLMRDTVAKMEEMQLFTGSTTQSVNKHTVVSAIAGNEITTSHTGTIDTGSLRIGAGINWLPSSRYFSKKRITAMVRVFNIIDQPLWIDYGAPGEDRMKAAFVIGDSLAVDKSELKKILRQKFGYYKVKLKPGFRNWFKKDDYKKKEYNRTYAERIGDSLWMPKEDADGYKLVPTATRYFVNYDLKVAQLPKNFNNEVYLSAGNSLVDDVSKKYGVQLNTLGWINCDRFYADKRKKINFTVRLAEEAANYHTMLVFDNIKSMMAGMISGNEVVFQNIPISEPVKVISIGINKHGEAVYSVTHTTTSEQGLSDLQFQTTSAPDLKASLSKLDN